MKTPEQLINEANAIIQSKDNQISNLWQIIIDKRRDDSQNWMKISEMESELSKTLFLKDKYEIEIMKYKQYVSDLNKEIEDLKNQNPKTLC